MSNAVLKGNTSGTGTVTLETPNTNTDRTISLPDATGTMVVNGANSAIVSGTAVASTSGTSIDFTSIPSWVKRITVMFSGVSTNGASFIQTQVGAGSVTTSGYLGSSQNMFTANNYQLNALSSGFTISAASAANICSGTLVFTLQTSNTWVGVGCFATNNAGASSYQQGYITLGGTLDRVRITTVNGTDTFDAGSINILYE